MKLYFPGLDLTFLLQSDFFKARDKVQRTGESELALVVRKIFESRHNFEYFITLRFLQVAAMSCNFFVGSFARKLLATKRGYVCGKLISFKNLHFVTCWMCLDFAGFVTSRRQKSGVGFIGLGNMGRPMAKNLAAAGHEVFVYDILPDQMQCSEKEDGTTAKSSPAEVAKSCDRIVTMLPNSSHVKEALMVDESRSKVPECMDLKS